jgi:outer membrane receptor for ferrienterochelin and colicins
MFGIAVVVRANDDKVPPPQDAMFGALPVVEAASLHAQTLEEAPANVTIVTEAEIRRYGYRTLGDVLSSVRGFFVSSDRIYQYVGVRGTSLLGDYNTRFLVMLNGHPLTDQVYNANGFFGQDLGIDMDLVSRIEIIRGPTSALYGSNGILANINIVTKSPVDFSGLRVSTENGSFGERKVGVTSSVYLGRGANLLVSASIFNNGGSTLQFPGVSPIAGVDGEKGYHTFANLVWHDWSFTAYFNNRQKQPPVPWGSDAVMFQRGDDVRDSRNYFLASYTRALGPGKLHWQVYYDQYKYDDRFYYPLDSSGNLEDLRSIARGDSVGSQLSWQTELGRIGELTVGTQVDGQLRNLQQNFLVYPNVQYSPAISHPNLAAALFAQQQWKVSSVLTLYGGVRLDGSRNFAVSLSPRLALVYQPSSKTVYKVVYGRPFRNPSAFEKYYTDGGIAFLPNTRLQPEAAQTLEVSAERKLRPNLSFIANVYDYHVQQMIQADFLAGDVQIFENSGNNESRGVEFEVNGKSGGRLEASASYSYQHASSSFDRQPDNLPQSIGKFRAATPLVGDRLWLSCAFQYMSGRSTRADAWTRPVALGDITISTHRLHPSFDFVVGIHNVANWRYSDPVGVALDQMPANGRSFFVKLIYHQRE